MPRFLAWLIDLAGITFMLGAIGQFVGPPVSFVFNDLGSQTDGPSSVVWRVLALGVFELAVILATEVVFLRTINATPGQRLVGLRTIASESELGLPWPGALGRAALLFGPWIATLVLPTSFSVQLHVFDEAGEFAWAFALPGVAQIVAVVLYVALAVSVMRAPDGRGFHDLASRSVVVRDAPGFEEQPT
jgi:uncharacterized RDD family membrane protein YckC